MSEGLSVIYTVAQIAEALGRTKQAINYRAAREGWPFQKRRGRGGGKALRPVLSPSGCARRSP